MKSPSRFSSTSSTAEGEGLFPSPSMLYIASRTFASFRRSEMDPNELYSLSVVLEDLDRRNANSRFLRKTCRSSGHW